MNNFSSRSIRGAGLALALTFALLCSSAAGQDANSPAGTFTVSLDELLGQYQPGDVKTIALDPAGWDWTIENAYLRLAGYVEPGQGDGFVPPPQFEIGIRSDPADGFTAISQQSGDGIIDLDILLAVGEPGMGSFLLGSQGEISIFMTPMFGMDLSTLPSMQIDSAELVIEGQPTVAVPEPTCLALLGAGATLLLKPRRRKKSSKTGTGSSGTSLRGEA